MQLIIDMTPLSIYIFYLFYDYSNIIYGKSKFFETIKFPSIKYESA